MNIHSGHIKEIWSVEIPGEINHNNVWHTCFFAGIVHNEELDNYLLVVVKFFDAIKWQINIAIYRSVNVVLEYVCTCILCVLCTCWILEQRHISFIWTTTLHLLVSIICNKDIDKTCSFCGVKHHGSVSINLPFFTGSYQLGDLHMNKILCNLEE